MRVFAFVIMMIGFFTLGVWFGSPNYGAINQAVGNAKAATMKVAEASLEWGYSCAANGRSLEACKETTRCSLLPPGSDVRKCLTEAFARVK